VIPSLTASAPPTLCTPFTVDIRDAFAPDARCRGSWAPSGDEPAHGLGGQLLVTPSWIIAFAVPQSAVSLPMDVCARELLRV
jgi:hypothetical protein